MYHSPVQKGIFLFVVLGVMFGLMAIGYTATTTKKKATYVNRAAGLPTQPSPTPLYYPVSSPDHAYYAPYIQDRAKMLRTGTRIQRSRPERTDLDVTFIERTPKYYRYCVSYRGTQSFECPGTEQRKHWPDVGEMVTYTAHVKNKGTNPSILFAYEWRVDGLGVSTGQSAEPLSYDDEFIASFSAAWSETPKKITFTVFPLTSDDPVVNNSRSRGTHDLTFAYWVERPLYERFNEIRNSDGTFSFEDWVQRYFSVFNDRLASSTYPIAASGALDRIVLDKVFIADQLDYPSVMYSYTGIDQFDGHWRSSDDDNTNNRGNSGYYDQYASEYQTNVDWGLIHEMAHQLGIIDLYRFRLPNRPESNSGIDINSLSGQLLTHCDMPNSGDPFPRAGIMGGGDTGTHDWSYFESHTIGGLNAHAGKRRGYYGEYLYDTPDQTKIKLLDRNGTPLSGAQVALYQRFMDSFSSQPVHTGTTDTNGLLVVPNRRILYPVSTATGHTLRDNPFGDISVVGDNGSMIVVVTKDIPRSLLVGEGYGLFLLTDLNEQYWGGNRATAIATIKTNFPQVTKDRRDVITVSKQGLMVRESTPIRYSFSNARFSVGQNMSYEAWIKFDSNNQWRSGRYGIVSITPRQSGPGEGLSAAQYAMYASFAAGAERGRIHVRLSGMQDEIVTQEVLPRDRWVHVALLKRDRFVQVIVYGYGAAEGQAPSTITPISDGYVRMGQLVFESSGLSEEHAQPMIMDEVRISTVARPVYDLLFRQCVYDKLLEKDQYTAGLWRFDGNMSDTTGNALLDSPTGEFATGRVSTPVSSLAVPTRPPAPTITPTPPSTPDLTVTNIYRTTSYSITYCNTGGSIQAGNRYFLRMAFLSPQGVTTANYLYPTALDTQIKNGQCRTISGISCSFLKDSRCKTSGGVRVEIDWTRTVAESNEMNNVYEVSFSSRPGPNPPIQ